MLMAVKRSTGLHEDLFREEEVRLSSNRNFGLLFAAVFAIIAVAPLAHGHAFRPWALIVAAVFLVVSLTKPDILRPFNMMWTKLGLLLQRVTSPIIIGLLFFAVVSPLALLMRLTRRDPMRLSWDREADSYWLTRVPPGPAPASMKDQF
jgi:Saxitoxin biosynthesis operon protein SxtJ